MNKEFIPYEQALALKKLGFKEECIAYYQESTVTKNKWVLMFASQFGEKANWWVTAPLLCPLYQQAFRWFREKHELYHSIIPYRSTHDNYIGGTFHIEIRDSIGKDHAEYDDNEYFYEEAELACLNKLIELVKQ